MRVFLIILACCGVGFVGPVQGQRYPGYLFRHIGQADGLLTSGITSIAQDTRGFIWIGTLNGLQRYDGTRFLNYREQLKVAGKGVPALVAWFNAPANNLMIRVGEQLEKLDLSSGTVSLFDTADIRWDLSTQ